MNTIEIADTVSDLSNLTSIEVADTVSDLSNMASIDEPTIDFGTKVKTWLENNTPIKVSIATVCPDGSCDTEYVGCLLQTLSLFRELNVEHSIAFANGDPLCGRARNELVAKVLSDPEITHILFINPDIVWDFMDVMKLIISDKDVIGGISPFKKYHFEELINASPESWIQSKNKSVIKDFVSDEKTIQHKLLKYKATISSETEISIKDNVAQINSISAGFLLVRRTVFPKLFEVYHHTKYSRFAGAELDDNLYSIFDSECRNNKYLGPDETFCSRWTGIGGEIFADVTIALGHVGKEVFNGHFLASLIN